MAGRKVTWGIAELEEVTLPYDGKRQHDKDGQQTLENQPAFDAPVAQELLARRVGEGFVGHRATTFPVFSVFSHTMLFPRSSATYALSVIAQRMGP